MNNFRFRIGLIRLETQSSKYTHYTRRYAAKPVGTSYRGNERAGGPEENPESVSTSNEHLPLSPKIFPDSIKAIANRVHILRALANTLSQSSIQPLHIGRHSPLYRDRICLVDCDRLQITSVRCVWKSRKILRVVHPGSRNKARRARPVKAY